MAPKVTKLVCQSQFSLTVVKVQSVSFYFNNFIFVQSKTNKKNDDKYLIIDK